MQGAEKVQYVTRFAVLQATFNLDQFHGVLCASSAYVSLSELTAANSLSDYIIGIILER